MEGWRCLAGGGMHEPATRRDGGIRDAGGRAAAVYLGWVGREGGWGGAVGCEGGGMHEAATGHDGGVRDAGAGAAAGFGGWGVRDGVGQGILGWSMHEAAAGHFVAASGVQEQEPLHIARVGCIY